MDIITQFFTIFNKNYIYLVKNQVSLQKLVASPLVSGPPAVGRGGCFQQGLRPCTPFLTGEDPNLRFYSGKELSLPSWESFSLIYSLPQAGLVALQKFVWLCHNFSPRLRRGGGFFCRGFAPAPHFSQAKIRIFASTQKKSSPSLPGKVSLLFIPCQRQG